MSKIYSRSDTDPVIAVHDDLKAAEAKVRTLSRAGFDMKKLSIVAKGYQTEEHKAHRFLVIVHGTASNVAGARALLDATRKTPESLSAIA